MDYRQLQVTVRLDAAASPFLAALHKQGMKLTMVRAGEHELTFRIGRQHLRALKRARRQTRAKVKLRYVKQAVLQPTLVVALGLLLLTVTPPLASQWIWQLQIESEMPELVDDVSLFLQQQLRVELPLRRAQLPPEMAIRQQIMAQFPQLAWVHFEKQQSRVRLTLQLAPKTMEPHARPKVHLAAKTSGVVTHYILTAGKLVVRVNETVEAGELLVSGVVEGLRDTVVTGAAGEVFADYWLETTFTMPRQLTYYEQLEPHWVWSTKPPYVDQQRRFKKHETQLEEADVERLILPLLQTKLLQSLAPKTTVKAEKVLHLTIDNDTVKGKVLYMLNENIAKPIPID